MTTGSGVEYVPAVVTERIESIGERREGLSVLCHTLPTSAGVDGLLGLDFFRGRRLVVDFRAGLVDVE